MLRTIAVIAVFLTACSGGSDKGTTSLGGAGSGGSVSSTGAGATTGAAAASSTGGTASTGGQSTTSGTGTGGPICGGMGPPVENFVKMFSAALCEWNFSCQADANYYYMLCNSYSAPGYNDLPAAVDAGRIQYCPSNGQNCLSGFTNAPCFGTPPQDSTACLEAFHGLVVTGSPCETTADCSGGYCQSDAGCAGTCVAWGEVNDPCTDSSTCNPSESLGCLNSKCTTPRPIDAPCGKNLPPCNVTVGLTCIAGECLAPPQGINKRCVFGLGQCVEGSYCFQKAGMSSGVCTVQVSGKDICGEDADHLRNAFSATDFECADGFTNNQCVGAGTLLDGGVQAGVCQSTSGEGSSCPEPPPGIDFSKPFGNGCLNGLDCFAPEGVGFCDRPNAPTHACDPLPFACDPTKGFCDYSVDAGYCVDAFRSGQACTAPDQCGVFDVCNDAGFCELPTGPVCKPAF